MTRYDPIRGMWRDMSYEDFLLRERVKDEVNRRRFTDTDHTDPLLVDYDVAMIPGLLEKMREREREWME